MIVYKVTNLVNGKVYVGYTSKTLSERMKTHFYKSNVSTQTSYNQAFKLALRKYGTENFKWEELETCNTKEQACEIEKHYISMFKSLTPNGYNMTMGGEGGIPNEDVKRKISESVKQFHKDNPGYTYKFYLQKNSPEQRRLNALKAAETKRNRGYTYPTGKRHLESSRQKMSISKGALYAGVWYNLKSEEILVGSTKLVSEILKVSIGTLSHIKHGRQPMTKSGWTFLSEVHEVH